MPIKNYKKARRKKSSDPLSRLRRRVKQDLLPDKDVELFIAPEGTEKMSEVLEEFVAPYAPLATNLEQMQKLYTVAIVAWNTTLLPQDQQQPAIDKLIAELPDDDETETDFREIVQTLMERKNSFFAANKRFIATFDLTDTGVGYHLSVASTFAPPPR